VVAARALARAARHGRALLCAAPALVRGARRARLVAVAAAGVAVAAAVLGAGSPAPLAAAECVVLEDFSKGKVGELPPEWKLRDDEGKGVYALREEGGRRFLRATARGVGIQAGRKVEWDLERYPVLTWAWRAVEFPTGADERKSKTNDSALAVYAVFPHTRISVRSLKYVWSALVPAGTQLESNVGLTKVRVLRSGTERRGQWVEERADVRADARARFGGSELPRPEGIAVLTDSDDTKSSAQGDYDSFRACPAG
jgi:hypothetical protein